MDDNDWSELTQAEYRPLRGLATQFFMNLEYQCIKKMRIFQHKLILLQKYTFKFWES